jgi:hypothetical protein
MVVPRDLPNSNQTLISTWRAVELRTVERGTLSLMIAAYITHSITRILLHLATLLPPMNLTIGAGMVRYTDYRDKPTSIESTVGPEETDL